MSKTNTEVIDLLMNQIKNESQPLRLLNELSIRLRDNNRFKDLVQIHLQEFVYNEEELDSYLCLSDELGLNHQDLSICTNSWYLNHFLEDSMYEEGVIQSESGLDLEEIVAWATM